MFAEYTQWIMLVSVLTSTLACFSTFGFVSSLYKATVEKYNLLLVIYALLVGSGLFVIHFINMRAFNHVFLSQYSVGNLLIAYGFSTLIGYTILDIANKKTLPGKLLFAAALQTGISGYAITYFFSKAMISGQFEMAILPALVATGLSMGVGALTTITLFWLKNYDGIHPMKMRMFFAVLISIGILATHMAFDASITYHEPTATTNVGMINTSFMTLLSAMVLIFVFLTAFIIIIFYDKVDQNAIKRFNFKSTKSGDRLSFDPLTKLPNRDALNQHLMLAAKRCERVGESMALAYIDLDHFKPVNDNFGHHVGDLLLIEVSERFNAAIRNCDYIGRAGGDEFVAILGEIDAHESIVAVVQRIVDSVKEPFYIEGHLIEISCSVGVAIYPKDGNLEKLQVSADAAMYKAKESGRNQYRFYDAEIEQASDEMQKLRNELIIAIEHNQFVLHFQPKVDAKTQAPAGAEALLRWNHPTKGLLTPIYFIEAAERFGFIEKINAWVIVEACKTIHHAKRKNIQLNISVNLSRQQFRNPQLVDLIKSIMAQYDVMPQSLVLEISETHAIHNQNQFKKLLSKFRIAHLKVSIDDFGLHPFSLTYLQNLEVSEVKLDKSFTAGVAKYASSLAIVEAVVKLAHALNLTVVAEGVETEAQYKALETTGCNLMQGYYFSKPMTESDLFALYTKLHHNYQETGQFNLHDYLSTETSSA